MVIDIVTSPAKPNVIIWIPRVFFVFQLSYFKIFLAFWFGTYRAFTIAIFGFSDVNMCSYISGLVFPHRIIFPKHVHAGTGKASVASLPWELYIPFNSTAFASN